MKKQPSVTRRAMLGHRQTEGCFCELKSFVRSGIRTHACELASALDHSAVLTLGAARTTLNQTEERDTPADVEQSGMQGLL